MTDPSTQPDPDDTVEPSEGGSTATTDNEGVFVADVPRRRWPLVLAAMAAVLLLIIGSAAAVARSRSGEALPGISIENIEVGGMTRDQVRDVVTDLVTRRQQAAVTVTAGDVTQDFVPGPEGYAVDIDRVVDAVMLPGRGSFPTAIGDHASATFGSTQDVALRPTVDQRVASTFVDDLAAAADRLPFDGEIDADPATLTVTVTEPSDGRTVDRDDLAAELTARIGNDEPTSLDAALTISPTVVDADAVAEARMQAEAVLAAPIVLTNGDDAVTITPADLALVLDSVVEGDRLVLTADPALLRGVIAPVRESLETSPVDATYELVSGLRTFDDQGNATFTPSPAELRVVPGADGTTVDIDLLAAQLTGMFTDGTREAPIQLAVERPAKNADVLGAADVNRLLGTFTTYHACCASRVTNIQRLADLIRGRILLPGETFSVNDFVGPRTAAKGFVEAGAIVNGRIEPEFGGGISQFATTMYNAAFFAGIPILDSRAHSLYISRYPLGREATLNFGSIDLKIANDTPGPMFLHTSYTSDSITVSIFGVDAGRTVTAVMGEPYNFRDVPTRTISNPALPSGARRTIQTGTGGYDVDFTRIIDYADGRRIEEPNTAIYSSKPTVIEVGTGPARPAPPPEPEPTPEPEPAPEPQPEPEPEPEPAPEPTRSDG